MPSPTQIRNERINELIEFGKTHGIGNQYERTRIDSLLNQASALWPNVRANTLMSYCEATLKILVIQSSSPSETK